MQHPVSFKNQKGETLKGIVHTPKKYNPSTGTAFVSLHGFPGSGMGKRSTRMGNLFSKYGMLFLRFDFSGSNTSDGNFADKLMSQEVREIKYAIDFLQKKYGFKKLILLGHSTGAIDASLYAHKDKRISKLILSGAVSDLKQGVAYDFNPIQTRQFWTQGFITYKRNNAREKSWVDGKRLKKAFYDEFFKLDIPAAMRKYKRQLLVIHGELDDAVPIKEAHAIYNHANKPKKLVIIKGAGHNYHGRRQMKDYLNAMLKFSK